MFASAVISVGTTATQLTGSGDGGSRPLNTAAVKNTGSVTVYLGGSGVVATATAGANAGYPLAAGEAIGLDALTPSDDLYGVVASGTCLVAVLAAGA